MANESGEALTELWRLIAARGSTADRTAIDRTIWDRFGGEWAVMATDLAGFSRRVARYGILHFLQTIFEHQRVMRPIVERHGGTVIKTEADSLLVLFPAAATGLACAIEMQRTCAAVSTGQPEEEGMVLCVGLGYGRVLRIEDVEVYGHEVNLASKLGEDTAKEHEILVTVAARAAIGDVAGVTWEELRADYAGETVCWRARYG
jgi:adenylate cyclase